MGLEFVDLVITVEEKFGIEIADEDAHNLTTPGLMVSYIMTKVKPANVPGGWSREQVREALRTIIVKNFGVTEFNDDSHFVDDMQIDC